MHQFYSLCSQIIGGIVVCLLIISFSVTLTLNFRPLYYADIQNLHITELSGREEKDIRSNYDALIDYNSLFNHQPLKFPTCAMSESGRIHFEEVKKIFESMRGSGFVLQEYSVLLCRLFLVSWLLSIGIMSLLLFISLFLIMIIGYLTLPRIRLLIFCRMDILCIVPS